MRNFIKGDYSKIKFPNLKNNYNVLAGVRQKSFLRKNKYYKKLYNLIHVEEFIEKYKIGTKLSNIGGYYIHAYSFDDAYISCCNQCAFVHKFVDGRIFTFKESSGLSLRLDEPNMNYAPLYDFSSDDIIEEDEVCLLCYMEGYNYWHFTYEVVPRLMAILKSGVFKGKFLVNDAPVVREFMKMLSVPEEKIIYNPCGRLIRAKKVFLFSDMFGIELREKFLSDTKDFIIENVEKNCGKLDDESLPKRIYVTRISRRRIINEQQIINILAQHGFEIIVPENLSIFQQMKLFHNADIIVTPHGANSTNILYSKPYTSFVECFGHMWVNPCMLYTIDILKIDYHMLCERLADYQPNANKYSDYILNTLLLYTTLRTIFEQRGIEVKK